MKHEIHGASEAYYRAVQKTLSLVQFPLYTRGQASFFLLMATVAQKPRGLTPLDGRQATERALKYFHSLFSSLSVSDVTLEEIELSEDGKFWMVTLGFNARRPESTTLPEFLRVPLRK